MSALMQRARAATQSGRLAEAVQWYRQVVLEDPDDIEARASLGQALCMLGHRHEGLPYVREAGQYLLENAADDGDIGAVLQIVQQLQRWNDFAGALALAEPAARLDPANARAFQLLAISHAQLHHKDAALQAGAQALRLAPDDTMMQVLQGSLEADAGRLDDAKTRLEALLSRRIEPRAEFRARKELARVLDRQGEYDRVFAELHVAGALGRTLPEYAQQDRALLPNLIDANRAGFDPALLGRWSAADFAQDRPAPVFLIGFFRSGTTLTQAVLDAHPDVFVADETDFIWSVQRELHRIDPSPGSTADKLRRLDRTGVQRLREHYWKRAQARFGDTLARPLFVDKFTLNTLDVGLIQCVFPDAKVLFVMRDPRDVCLSCFMQLMVPSPATAQLLNWQDTADFYARVMDWWLHIRPLLALPTLEFRYEDAVAGFDPTYRRVFEFLGLAWDPAVAQFHRHAAGKFIASPSRSQVTEPLYASSVGRWRHYAQAFAPVSGRLARHIEAAGYAPD